MATTVPAARRRAPIDAQWALLGVVCLSQLMVIVDISVVNVALPSIRRDLGFNQAGLQWVINAYTLMFAGFLLLGGRAADLFGHRRLLTIGLVMFTAASLVGGLSQTQSMLVMARGAQGLGAAVLSPATLAVLTTNFVDGRERSRAMGVWGAVSVAGGGMGAVLGGLLVDQLSWRWILFINVPVGVVALIGSRIFIPATQADDGERPPLDLIGGVLVTSGLVAVTYGLVRTSSLGWSSSVVHAWMGGGFLLLGLFVANEMRWARAPLMTFRLLRSRAIAGSNVVGFGINASTFAMWFFITLYLQGIRGYSALRAGLAFQPMTMAVIIGTYIGSRAVMRLGVRALVLGPCLMCAIGLLWLSRIGPHSQYWQEICLPGICVAMGIGLSSTPIILAATSDISVQEAGLASGLVNTTRQIGASVGLAVLATLASSRAKSVLGSLKAPTSDVTTRALTSGYSVSLRVAAGIAIAGTIAALVIPRRAPGPTIVTQLDPIAEPGL
jgi:EmrB/QacA subfamily drug resistance transporter